MCRASSVLSLCGRRGAGIMLPPLQSPRKHPVRILLSFRVRKLRRHVFFHAGNQGIVILSCHKCAKRNRIPLPYASSFTSLHRCTAPAGHFGHQGNAGRTPLSLFTLLPLLLTKPSLLTFAALLSLLPGERSHQKKADAGTTLQPCPLFSILSVFHAPVIAFHPCAQEVLDIIDF